MELGEKASVFILISLFSAALFMGCAGTGVGPAKEPPRKTTDCGPPGFTLIASGTVLVGDTDWHVPCDDLVTPTHRQNAKAKAQEYLDEDMNSECKGNCPGDEKCVAIIDHRTIKYSISEKLYARDEKKKCYLTCEIIAKGRCICQ